MVTIRKISVFLSTTEEKLVIGSQAFCSLGEAVLAHILTTVMAEDGFSFMNINQSNDLTRLDQNFTTGSMVVSAFVKSNPEARSPSIAFLRELFYD